MIYVALILIHLNQNMLASLCIVFVLFLSVAFDHVAAGSSATVFVTAVSVVFLDLC